MNAISKRQRTAYHEAGHAVMEYLRMPRPRPSVRAQGLGWVSIRADADTLGRTALSPLFGRPRPQCEPSIRANMVARIEVFLAGPIAEARRLTEVEVGDRGTVDDDVQGFERTAADQRDLTEAKGLAVAISFTRDEARYLVHSLARRTAGRFRTREQVWHAVATLAAALLGHEELEGCHAHWVIRQALNGVHYGALQDKLFTRVARGPGTLYARSKKAERLGR